MQVTASGDTTGGVVVTTTYLTVHLVSVILTGIDRVVVVVFLESVVTLLNIVLVNTVQTTDVYTENGMNQMVHRNGDTTGGVVGSTPYLTVHLVSVILTGINRVVVIGEMDGVLTLNHIVCVLPV